jgi:hypothetical protein
MLSPVFADDHVVAFSRKDGTEHKTWKLDKKDYLKNDHSLVKCQFVTDDGKDLPQEKMPKFSSKDAAYNFEESRYSNPESHGSGVKDPLASVDKNEQKVLLDNIEENTEEAKQRKREEEEKAKRESDEAFRLVQEENAKKLEKLEAEKAEALAKAAKDFQADRFLGQNQEEEDGCFGKCFGFFCLELF